MKNFASTAFRVMLLSVLLFTACREDKNDDPKPGNIDQKSKLVLEYKAEASGKTVQKYDTITHANGQKYVVSLLRYYAGNIRLVKEDGTEINLKEIALVDHFIAPDAKTDDKNTIFNFEIPAGNYKGIRFGLGVPENLNGLKTNSHNPSQYAPEHPLGINSGTSWSMAGGGYRFVMFDGRGYKKGTTGKDTSIRFSYHTGFDTLYRNIEINKSFTVKAGETSNFSAVLDVNKIFYNNKHDIDIWIDPITHSGKDDFDLAVKITENLVSSFK